MIYLVQDDKKPDLEIVITKDGQPVDLTGYSVYFTMRNKSNGALKINKAQCLIVNEKEGLVKYQWNDNDLDTPGEYECEVEVVDTNGNRQTSYEKFYITIREKMS